MRTRGQVSKLLAVVLGAVVIFATMPFAASAAQPEQATDTRGAGATAEAAAAEEEADNAGAPESGADADEAAVPGEKPPADRPDGIIAAQNRAAGFSLPAETGDLENTGVYGAYNAGDIAIVNAIIEKNRMHWQRWTEGGTPPLHWSAVGWTDGESGKRVKSLDVSVMGLTSLEVSGLDALESLSCWSNSLTELDLSGLAALKTLSCGGNSLTALDLSGQPALERLDCAGNPLERLMFYGGYDISLKTEPAGSGTVSAQLSIIGNLAGDGTVSGRLTATPNTGYSFTHWTRTGSDTNIEINPWNGLF